MQIPSDPDPHHYANHWATVLQAQKIQQERRLRRLENERRVLQQKRAELNQYIRQQGRDTTTQQALAQTQVLLGGDLTARPETQR